MMKRWAVVAGMLVAVAASVSAQQQTVEADPLQCWWRTSVGAVRIGQPFSVVLTCAVIETDTVTVVPDQAPLDPTVVQMPPFEMLGGARQADLRTTDRRFFQYEYQLRLIGEDSFGKDVKLPETKIAYRVRTRVSDGPPIEGREQTYLLPPISVRVLSLVPADAADIRDASASTFGDAAARAFRADVLRVTATVLFALAGLVVALAGVRVFSRYRAQGTAHTQIVTDREVLRQIGRELTAIERDRTASGWTPQLAGRLTTAVRLAAAYALGQRVPQLPNNQITQLPDSPEGAFSVRTGWRGRTSVAVAASATPETIRRQLAPAAMSAPALVKRVELLKDLERALTHLTEAQYGRDAGSDEQAAGGLDDALSVGVKAVREVAASHTWLGRRFSQVLPIGQQAWSR